jgi:hypothetical protein
VLQAATLVVLVAVLLFFGLTRTQVGREGLRGQIERSFAQQFRGTLEIGRLSGNLVYDLYATDVRLRDPKGRVVLAADSVVVEPSWRGLLGRRLVLDEATLFRPRLDLVRNADGRWNLGDVFAPRRSRTEPGRPLDVSAPVIQLVDGAITTRNLGTQPAIVRAGTLFDYTSAALADLDAAIQFTWEEGRRTVDVKRLSARLTEPAWTVERLSGSLDLTDGLRLRDVELSTPGSWIVGHFSRTRPSPDAAPVYDLHLTEGLFDGDEVRRLVPALPLAGDVRLAADVEGPLADLVVEHLALARGSTDLQAAGTLVGLPDSAAFAFSIPAATIRHEDLAAVLPSAPLPELRRLGTVRFEGDLDGLIADGHLRLSSSFDVRTAAGRADGTLRIARRAGQPLTYDLDAMTAGLDPGRLLSDPRWNGSISGRVELAGRGTGLSDLNSRLRLALTESRLAGRSVEALDADVAAEDRRLRGTVRLAAGGDLVAEGAVDLAGMRPAFDLGLRADDFDLRRLLPAAPPTDLTATASLTGDGVTLDSFQGDLAVGFAPSSVTISGTERPIPAHDAALRIRPPGTSEPRLTFDSDLALLRADGNFDFGEVVALGQQWAEAFVRTARAETAKYYRTSPDRLRSEALALAAPVDVRAQRLALHSEIRRPDALRALVPGFPGFAPGTAFEASAVVGPDDLALDLRARGDSLRVPRVESGAFEGTLALRSDYGPDLLGRSTFGLRVSADTLRLPIGPLADATVDAELRDRTLNLAVQSDRLGEAGRLALDAGLAFLPDVNRLTLRRLDLTTAGQTWTTPGPQAVDLYADLIRIGELAVERQSPGTPPRLALRGAVSPLASDSLYVEASALDLDEVFSLLGLRDLFGGRLDAELAVASVLGQPVVVGEAAVDRFTFAGRRAGEIALSSRYVPGTDAVAVDLRLLPDGDSLSVENDLRATGTVRFPGRAEDGTRDPGALNLALDIDRLDLFVFDWLFPAVIDDAGGYATGTGRITGVPRVPLFDADLRVRDGRFRVPAFGLALEAEGRVTIDREGFHIRNALLADKSGGQGLVRGDVLFNDYRFFSLDLTADLAEMEIIDVPSSRDLPFYGHIRASGTASVTGPLDNVFLHAPDAQTTADSEIFIPVTASGPAGDAGFLVFADSLGNVPEFEARRSLIAQRPENERAFLEGLEMNLGVAAPPGSTVHLVFDPAVGDVITAVGSAQLQLAIREGEFLTFGTFDVTRGDYLFTAGDVFTRRFELEEGGTLRWDGDPIDARLDLPATYRTRASLAGLDLAGVDPRQRVPLLIGLDVSGRVTSPLVDLSIALDETNRQAAGGEALRRQLNQSDRQAEYATSVLLTNTFLLAPSENPETIREAADELFFTSLSQLVSTRLNLFLNDALAAENVDVLVGVQQGATAEDFDLTYGVALRLLDERLVIRGEGIYQRLSDRPVSEELQGEVAVEVRLGPSVSLEVFYRREGDVLLGSSLSATPYGAYGAGVNYETDFASWRALLRRIVGEAVEERPAASAAPF